ncbi:MAG: diaminopimelate epimerase [Cyclobacteriaceae bacterium]
MVLNFSKYQGTGNDFVMIDNRQGLFPKNEQNVVKLCDRKFGIGADGLILIEEHPDLDYRMVYFNSDGTQSLCGNGSRCGFAFAKSLGMVNDSARFETTDGIHDIKEEAGIIHFGFPTMENKIAEVGGDKYMHTGSPHYVRVVDDVEDVDVYSEGKKIRNLAVYSSQNGTNVNFAQLLPEGVKMRTYERGVEDETLSCGTGATAVALVASQHGLQSPVKLETKGGTLSVSFELKDGFFENIWLAGPAEKVFEGTVTI